MDNGFYALYLYVRRKQAIGFFRITEEVRAYDSLQGSWPMPIAAIKVYCDGWAHDGVLTPAQVKWAVFEFMGRVHNDLKFFKPATLSRPERLHDVMAAYTRLLIVLANWAASERVWSETHVEFGDASGGEFLSRRWREARYVEMYGAVEKATRDVRTKQPYFASFEPRRRRGAISA